MASFSFATNATVVDMIRAKAHLLIQQRAMLISGIIAEERAMNCAVSESGDELDSLCLQELYDELAIVESLLDGIPFEHRISLMQPAAASLFVRNYEAKPSWNG
jgi:hypothetical protein